MIGRALLAAGCGLLLAGSPLAAPLDGARVEALIEAALSRAGQQGTPVLSAHRRFPDCATTPTVTPRAGSWQAVTLACEGMEGEKGWRRVVRVKGGRAAPRDAGGMAEPDRTRALVLRESLPRGTVLTSAHLTTAEIPAAGRDDLVRAPATALGRTLKVNLGAGQALLGRHLDHDWAVEEGARVTITGSDGPIRIETAGVATEPGQLGQDIRVRNARSGRFVDVTVTGPNKVAVRPNMR